MSNSITIPLFVNDDDMSIGTLVKQASAFGMGGWWVGGTHMKANESFSGDVQQQILKDAKVIVACQKGLRSLAAAEQVRDEGEKKRERETG